MIYFAYKPGFVKIGYSKDPSKRLKQLQTGCPERLKIICKIPGDKKLERKLQKLFWRNLLDDEWFYFTTGLKLYIKRLTESSKFVEPNYIELFCVPDI
jgi:hypothetical protein